LIFIFGTTAIETTGTRIVGKVLYSASAHQQEFKILDEIIKAVEAPGGKIRGCSQGMVFVTRDEDAEDVGKALNFRSVRAATMVIGARFLNPE
ncbi:hypothetical protein L208DRAFT_1145524, partial [Tricholoma matsutake]